ncbi:MAG: hypothetical protein F4X64_12480 [Chloroflexi bacterium]|nr:hypothetical protein [Chloroflexota bacterium]
MFDQLFNDTITIVNSDGTKHEGIAAIVQKEKVTILDVSIPISTNGTIERLLPSGQLERLSIIDYHLSTGMGGIPDVYEISIEREGTRRAVTTQDPVNIHVSDSPQARINLNSTDQSRNSIIIEAQEIFARVRDLIKECVQDGDGQDQLLDMVDDMETSHQSGDYKTAYQRFMALAADHLTVLAPILPRLASLL